MTDETEPPEGKTVWVPEGAIVMYPVDLVVEMFGHKNPGSTRKLMTGRNGYTMVRGWPVEEVDWVRKSGWDADLAAKRRRKTDGG